MGGSARSASAAGTPALTRRDAPNIKSGGNIRACSQHVAVAVEPSPQERTCDKELATAGQDRTGRGQVEGFEMFTMGDVPGNDWHD